MNVEVLTHFHTAGTINDVIFEFLIGYFFKNAEIFFLAKILHFTNSGRTFVELFYFLFFILIM